MKCECLLFLCDKPAQAIRSCRMKWLLKYTKGGAAKEEKGAKSDNKRGAKGRKK